MADVGTVISIGYQLDNQIHVVRFAWGDQLLQIHAPQNAAREAPPKEASLTRHQRQAAFHRLHRGVVARKSNRIEHYISASQECVKIGERQPGKKPDMVLHLETGRLELFDDSSPKNTG